jgi:hypothetical protein
MVISSGGAFSRFGGRSMGLRREFLQDLLTLKRLGALEKAQRVIEIGSQQLSDTFLASTDLLDQAFGRLPRYQLRSFAPLRRRAKPRR